MVRSIHDQVLAHDGQANEAEIGAEKHSELAHASCVEEKAQDAVDAS